MRYVLDTNIPLEGRKKKNGRAEVRAIEIEHSATITAVISGAHDVCAVERPVSGLGGVEYLLLLKCEDLANASSWPRHEFVRRENMLRCRWDEAVFSHYLRR